MRGHRVKLFCCDSGSGEQQCAGRGVLSVQPLRDTFRCGNGFPGRVGLSVRTRRKASFTAWKVPSVCVTFFNEPCVGLLCRTLLPALSWGTGRGTARAPSLLNAAVRPQAWRPCPTLRIFWAQKDTLSGGPCMCQGGSRETNAGQHSECRHRAEKLPVEKGRKARRLCGQRAGWRRLEGGRGALARPELCIDL